MKLSFEGVAEQVVTLQVDTASSPMVEAGAAAALSANGTVKVCPVSTVPAGVIKGVKDGLASVQVAGYMRFPAASGLAVGYTQLALDASGKLASGSGRGGLVVDVDEDGTCGVIFC